MTTYTAFCQSDDGRGTIWINSVEGRNPENATDKAVAMCATDWGCRPQDVHCLGLALGDIEIVFWEDIDE